MYNFNSPIINNMIMQNPGMNFYSMPGNNNFYGNPYNNPYNRNMYNPMQQQPMNGYYNNYYNNRYMNPYQFSQYNNDLIKKQKEHEEQQNNIMKMIISKVNKCMDRNLSDEQIDSILMTKERAEEETRKEYERIYQNDFETANKIARSIRISGRKPAATIGYNDFNEIRMSSYKVINIEKNGIKRDNGLRLREFFARSHEEFRKEFPSDMSLNDYLNKSGILLARQLEAEIKANNYKLTNLYDSGGFNSIISKFKNRNSITYPTVFGSDISDIEIPKINNNYNERRQAFLNKILSGGA